MLQRKKCKNGSIVKDKVKKNTKSKVISAGLEKLVVQIQKEELKN
jgi:hypothetical protein